METANSYKEIQDVKTVRGLEKKLLEKASYELQEKQHGQKSDMNIGQRVLVWGRQNGSWFSQSALQHEWISIINCSVRA